MSTELHPTSDCVASEIIVQHASLLYQAMVLSHEEFHRVLHQPKLTDVAYLVNTAKFLRGLNIIYENDVVIMMAEKQISVMIEKYLPEMACVSFKALKDGYSDSLSG